MITQSQLKELLSYDPETGLFTWKPRDIKCFSYCKRPEQVHKSWNARFANIVAGCVHKVGRCEYVQIYITINGKSKKYSAHILAFLYMTGKYPDGIVDHKNQNGLDNRRTNLRDVSHSINLQNSKMHKDNTSGFNGVYWNSQRGKWHVRINKNRKCFDGGYFYNLDDAIEKRKQMNLEHGFSANHGKKNI